MSGMNDDSASPSRSVGLQYVLSLCGLALATLLRLPFEGWLHGRAPYALYFPVLVATAWFCGTGPTLLAAFVVPVLALFFITPGALSPDSGIDALASVGVYSVSALSLIWLARRAVAIREVADRSREAAERLAAIVEGSDDAIISKDL